MCPGLRESQCILSRWWCTSYRTHKASLPCIQTRGSPNTVHSLDLAHQNTKNFGLAPDHLCIRQAQPLGTFCLVCNFSTTFYISVTQCQKHSLFYTSCSIDRTAGPSHRSLPHILEQDGMGSMWCHLGTDQGVRPRLHILCFCSTLRQSHQQLQHQQRQQRGECS